MSAFDVVDGARSRRRNVIGGASETAKRLAAFLHCICRRCRARYRDLTAATAAFDWGRGRRESLRSSGELRRAVQIVRGLAMRRWIFEREPERPRKPASSLTRWHVVVLRLRRELAHRHVFDHAPTQWADSLLGHGDAPVLTEVANASISRQGVPSRQMFSCRPQRSHSCRASGLVRWPVTTDIVLQRDVSFEGYCAIAKWKAGAK